MADAFITIMGAAHVFTALVMIISIVFMIGELVWDGSANRFKKWGIVLLVFSILTYFLAGWWYVTYYTDPGDKGFINGGSMDWGHKIIMETKEHIFIAGFWLAVVIFLFSWFATDEKLADETYKKALLWMLLTLIIGVFIMDFFGGLIIAALKVGLEEAVPGLQL